MAGDISEHLDASKLASIGADVVRDWHMDKDGNKEWRERAEKALASAAQEAPPEKTTPFPRGSSNVQYPLLTISALAFQSRAAPAIMKGDEAVKVKTFGRDANGKKAARAKRMAEYMNWKLFYDIDGWEQDTDAMLLKLPAVGQHYRKVYWDFETKKPCIESISALHLTIPCDARTLKSSPRITHDFTRYPYELRRMMAAGAYREVDLIPTGEDDQAARVILEQHRMMDLDGDDIEEPYVVTVDEQTAEVLRIEEAFGDEDITEDDAGNILRIDRWCPFVDYQFIPDPRGRAYAIGFGYLLTPMMNVINTIINMELDAGHAQVAGGGFVAAELRLQGAGKNGGVIRFQPGEYKTVNATGQDLKNSIVERTFPEPSAVLFQLLGLLMEAAKDIASVNEAITGDAARTAPVGTTLALIEQGQQVFNGIYKRIYRALREEFRLLADCLARYGDPQEYARFVDVEPEMMGHNGGPPMDEMPPAGQVPQQDSGLMGAAKPMGTEQAPGMAGQGAPIDVATLFREDFDDSDLDIRPVSDPSAITQTQKLGKAQFVLSLLETQQVNPKEAVRSALEAANVENIDDLMTMPQQGPDPVQLQMLALEAALQEALTGKAQAEAQLSIAKAAQIANESTGAQADAALAETQSKATLNHAKAMEIAGNAVGDPEAEAAEVAE
jgi:chaperonin GroES